jgi:hypothetical protein
MNSEHPTDPLACSRWRFAGTPGAEASLIR